MPTFRTSALRHALSLFALLFLCVACAPPLVVEPVTPPPAAVVEPLPAVAPAVLPVPLDKAQLELASGVASYENGSYKLATRQFQNALAVGLYVRADQARAHKYLAFMYCVGGKERQCRDEFRKALSADPAFDLTPAESGHPTWGPIFRKLKAAAK